MKYRGTRTNNISAVLSKYQIQSGCFNGLASSGQVLNLGRCVCPRDIGVIVSSGSFFSISSGNIDEY